MQDYITTVQSEVSFLKPKLEEILGSKIEDFPIKSYAELEKVISQRVDDYIAQYLTQGKRIKAWWLRLRKQKIIQESTGDIKRLGTVVGYPEFSEDEGILYANERRPIDNPSLIRVRLAHEITHFYVRSINEKFKDREYSHRLTNIFLDEGLSEYVSLDLPPLIDKSEEVMHHINEEKGKLGILAERCRKHIAFRYDLTIAPYAIGYQFTKMIVKELGKESIPKIILNPPSDIKIFYQPNDYLNKIRKI